MPRWPEGRELKNYPEVKVGRSSLYRHRLRAEKALGKPLPPLAVVHHAEGDLGDGPIVICQNQAYHLLLHQRARVVRHGGDPDTERFCAKCERVRPVADFKPRRDRPSGRESQCRFCRNTADSRLRRRRSW